jgi:lactoylglutathione lyase
MPKINHVALKVTDLEKATRFYENVYGFRQVRTGRSRGHISRHMTDGYIDLALMVYDSEDDAEAKMVGPGPAIHHFGIEVEDYEGFAEKVFANGGTTCPGPARSRSNTARPTAPSPRSSRRGGTRRCGSAAPPNNAADNRSAVRHLVFAAACSAFDKVSFSGWTMVLLAALRAVPRLGNSVSPPSRCRT